MKKKYCSFNSNTYWIFNDNIRKIKKYALSFFFVLNVFLCNAQNKKEKMVIENFITSYNNKEYSKMRKDFFLIARIILSEKKIKSSFEEIYRIWGQFKIENITTNTKNQFTISLLSERDSTETEDFVLRLNKRKKIVSFFKKNNTLQFPENAKILTITKKSELIDSLMLDKSNKKVFNGCVCVMDSGRVIYKNCFGLSDFAREQKLEPNSIFYLASCSKQFTAMAIMILIESGKININDHIQKYYPTFPYDNITIEHLLTHTSGLPDYFSLMHKYWAKEKQATNEDVISLMTKHKPKAYFKPGEDFDYSNTGYVILASIIEKSSGVSFSNFIDSSIFKKLGMKNSFVGGSSYASNLNRDNWAYGHVYSDSLKGYVIPDKINGYEYLYYLNNIYGDGNINSSIDDLIIWEYALRDSKLISNSNQLKMYDNHMLNSGKKIDYGYGFCVGKSRNSFVYHSGGWAGYHNLLIRFLNDDKAIFILSNNEYPSFNQLATKIGNIILK
jgi:CubicO group peptidase (beta-lactamase class C family)